MRPPPVYPPEPQREGGLYNREEVEGVLIERAYQQLIRHPSYGRVWNMQPVVRAHARLVEPEKPHCSRSSAQVFVDAGLAARRCRVQDLPRSRHPRAADHAGLRWPDGYLSRL